MADPIPRDSTPPQNPSTSSLVTPRRTPGRAAASPRTTTPSRKRAAEASSTHASPAAKRVAAAATRTADDEDEKAVEESMELDDPSVASTSTGPPRAVHVDERRIRPAAFTNYSAFMDEMGVPAAPAESSSAATKSPAPGTAPKPPAQPPARGSAAGQKEPPVTADRTSRLSDVPSGGAELPSETATNQAETTANAASSALQPPQPPARPAPPAVATSTPTRTSPRIPRVAQSTMTPSRLAAGPSTTPAAAKTPAAGPSTTPSGSSRSRESAAHAQAPATEADPATPGPSSTPSATPAAATAAAAMPQAKTPRSRRSAAHTAESNRILSAPIEPIETEGGEAEAAADTSEWGKRWEITQNAIELAVKAATQRWTVQDMETCFPRLAKQNPRGLRDVYINVVHSMRTKILEQKDEVFKTYNVAEALRMIDEVVNDAKAHAAKNQGPRPDAWRADVSPQAMTAATNLQLYDLTWDRLRTEYQNLHADVVARSKSLREKQAQLLETEGSVAEGVVDLEKTIKLMEGCPTLEMTAWMEKVSGSLDGARRP